MLNRLVFHSNPIANRYCNGRNLLLTCWWIRLDSRLRGNDRGGGNEMEGGNDRQNRFANEMEGGNDSCHGIDRHSILARAHHSNKQERVH